MRKNGPGSQIKWREPGSKLTQCLPSVQLDGLTKPLENLSESFINLVGDCMKDGGPIAGGIRSLGRGLLEFADALGSQGFQAQASKLGSDVDAVVRLFDSIAATNPEGLATALGIAWAARRGWAAVAVGTALARSGVLGVLGEGAASPVGALAAGGLAASGGPTNEGVPEIERQRRFHQGRFPSSVVNSARRKAFGHPHLDRGHGAQHIGGSPQEGAAEPGTPWNRAVYPLEVIHGSTQGVDKRLLNTVAAGAADLPPGYKVKVFSGFRGGDPGAHGRGQAVDVEIVDPQGNVIPSRGEDKTGMYRRLARYTYAEMKAKYPDLAENKFAWGGSFGTQKGGGGVSDLMHFDIMKRRGGVRASHYPQVQQMGALPLDRRTLSEYVGHHPATETRRKLVIRISGIIRQRLGKSHRRRLLRIIRAGW
jgi:hypothetical protein